MRWSALLLETGLHQTAATYTRRGSATKWKKTGRRASHGGPSVRDSLGMLIPEACLRRRKISTDAFDRSIEEISRDILSVDDAGVRNLNNYGASFDQRKIRFQGKGGDFRQFAEMAAIATSAENCDDAALRNDSIPTNAVAFVGRKRLGDTGDVSEETRKGKGTSAMLQRAFKHHGKTLPALSDAIWKDGVASDLRGETEVKSASFSKPTLALKGKRRAERCQRRLERMSLRGGAVHPCLCQGGCSFRGGAVMCPFAQYPATLCVSWLRHGRCDDYLSGCCPWQHGDVTNTSKRGIAASSIFYDDGWADVVADDDCRSEVLLNSCKWMSTLLQAFFDVVVSAIEGAELGVGERMLTTLILQQYLEKVQGVTSRDLNEKAADIFFHFDSARCVLSIEWELAVSALMTEEIEPLDKSFESKLETFTQSGCIYEEKEDRMDKGQRVHDVAEERIRRMMATFIGYLSVLDMPEESGVRIALCAPITRWLLQRIVDDYNQRNNAQSTLGIADLTPQELFEEASIFLLRSRLEMFGVCNIKEGGEVGKSHRWSALLLLQLMVLLARISVPCAASPAMECFESSFLFTKMLVLFHKESGAVSQGYSVQTEYLGYCLFLHSVLSKLALALICDGANMFALARPALIDVARRLADNIEVYFAKPLLRFSGWLAWTDEQMFESNQLVGHTAADYVQFHLPLIAHSFVASALNIFLLHVVREASQRYQLRQSPIAAALLDSSSSLESPYDLISWERCLCGNYSPQARKGIQSYVVQALAIFVSLQEENNAVLARRQQLIEEFMTRREEYRKRVEEETGLRKNSNVSISKNNKTNFVDNDEFHIFEKLLPHGSVMISADILGLLFRVLFEGGGAYKALRMAASAIHVSRMLRHAAKQPMSHIVQSEKTVYKRVRHSNTGKKRVIRTRVPVLRRVDAEVNNRTHGGFGARPVGLYMQLGEASVVEVARMGIRMGAAGERLVHGVCEDCMRGSLVDHVAGRCLFAPAAADVHSDGSISSTFEKKALQTLLSIAGVGGYSSGGRGQPHHLLSVVIHERRVPPTSLLLEVLVALTPSDNREMHTKYERWCGTDPQLLVNDKVFLAQQYHTARHHFGRALSMAAFVWLEIMRAGAIRSLSRQSIAFLHKEEYMLPVPTGFSEFNTSSNVHNCHYGLQPSHSPSPRTLEELKDYLTQSEADSSMKSVVHQQRIMHASYIQKCFFTCATNPNVLCRMRWAVFAGTLLAINDGNLTGKQRAWSCLLLRNVFILAQQAANFRERAQYMQATVKIFFLLNISCSSFSSSKVDKQLPWYNTKIRDLPQFLAVQLWLVEQLQTVVSNETIFWQAPRSAQLLSDFKSVAGLLQCDVNQTNLKTLLEPFIQMPDIGVKWLQESFFQISRDLLIWITARINKRDSHAMLALAAWSSFLYLNGALEPNFHVMMIAECHKKCTEEQQKILNEWCLKKTPTKHLS